ncbi:MAG: hypothetical protein HY376_01105 [Candidatus Blackburnbacteria bacterium]|nr:hypothetical protein [Candidatus Blackburnbacteria bacterium]
MHFHSIREFLFENVVVEEGSFFVGSIDKGYLIGPLVDDNFCPNCFKKRLLSSSVVDVQEYKGVEFQVATELYENLKRKTFPVIAGLMWEFDVHRTKILKEHHILSVPGCKNCFKNS